MSRRLSTNYSTNTPGVSTPTEMFSNCKLSFNSFVLLFRYGILRGINGGTGTGANGARRWPRSDHHLLLSSENLSPIHPQIEQHHPTDEEEEERGSGIRPLPKKNLNIYIIQIHICI